MIEKDFAENIIIKNENQEEKEQKKEIKEEKEEEQKVEKKEQTTFEKLCTLQKLIKNEAFLRDIGKYYYFNYK